MPGKWECTKIQRNIWTNNARIEHPLSPLLGGWSRNCPEGICTLQLFKVLWRRTGTGWQGLTKKDAVQKPYSLQAFSGHWEGFWNSKSEQNKLKAKSETWEIDSTALTIYAQEDNLLEYISLHVKLLLSTTVDIPNFYSLILHANQKSKA